MHTVHRMLLPLIAMLVMVGEAGGDSLDRQGSYALPGKLFLSVHALGVQTSLDGNTFTIFKGALQLGGKLVEAGPVTVWLGGEVGVGGRPNVVEIEPGLFVMLTFERLVKVPIVPYVRAGFAGALIHDGDLFAQAQPPISGTFGTGGALRFKAGAGAHYYPTRHLGLGAEANFAIGAAFDKDRSDRLFTVFAGYFELLLGIRTHF